MRSTQFFPKYDPPIPEIAAGIRQGQSILFPTDTVWEIASDAFNRQAYDQLYAIKRKPKNNALILLVSGIDMLKRYVSDIHPRIETLLVYHKRPLTIVYSTPKDLPEHVLEKDGTVAIRIVRNQLCKEIIEHLNSPIAASSANICNGDPAKSFEDVSPEIMEQVDMIISRTPFPSKESSVSVIAKYDEMGELIVLRE